jgi:hypothetical protein
MPNDLLALKKIYPDSKIASKYFHYVEKMLKNVEYRVPIINDALPPGWFRFSDDTEENDELRVIASGSEYFSNGNIANLGIAKRHKFMATRNDFKNVEATWYLKYENGTDPWCIFTRSTGRRTHKHPCLGCSYRAYFNPNGQVRLAKESYFGNIDFASDWKQAISGLANNQTVGMKFICFNLEDDTAVRLELWLDELNLNDWKLVDSFTDIGNNWGSGARMCGCDSDLEPITWGGPIVGFRCEGSSPSNTNFTFTNMTVREINAGGQFAEARAGDVVAIAGGGKALASTSGNIPNANTGGGIGDGATAIANDTVAQTGTGANNFTNPIFTVNQSGSSTTTGLPFPVASFPGTGGTTSAPISSPSSGSQQIPTTGSSQAPERPLVTVYKDLGLMYNIVLDHESACDVGSPFAIDYRQIYSASGVDTQEIKMFAKSGGIVRAGLKARSTISIIVGKTIRKVVVALRKFGNPTTGFMGMEIRDKNGNLAHTFPTTIDPATISTGAFGPTFTFTSDGNTHVCQTGDMLLLTYTNGSDVDANNCIILKSTDKDEIDGFDSCLVTQAYNATTYSTDQEKDFISAIFI